MSLKQLQKDVRDTAKKHGVRMYASKAKMVKYGDGSKASGYFLGVGPHDEEGTKSVLAYATGKPANEWIPTLVHESSHMDQWIEDIQIWKDVDLVPEGAYTVISYWIAGDPLDEYIDQALEAAFALELDCEQRSLAKIKKYELDLNHTEYIQKSNAYVMFYRMIRKHRKWYNSDAPPYETEAAWSKMPTEFVTKDTVLTPELEAALMNCV